MWQINHIDFYQLISFAGLIHGTVTLGNSVVSQEKQSSTPVRKATLDLRFSEIRFVLF